MTRADAEARKECHTAHKTDVLYVFFERGLFIERLIPIV